MPAAPPTFDAAVLVPRVDDLKTFLGRYYEVHPIYHSEVTRKSLWEELHRGFKPSIRVYNRDHKAYGDGLMAFLEQHAQNPEIHPPLSNGQMRLAKKPRRTVVLKLRFDPATLVPVPGNGYIYLLEAPDGALTQMTKDELDRSLFIGDEEKVGIAWLSSQCDAAHASSFVTELITSEWDCHKYDGYFGLPAEGHRIPRNAQANSFVIFDAQGQLRGACAFVNLPSKKANLTRKRLLEIVCIGARGGGARLLDVAELYGKAHECFGIYVNSLDMTPVDPGTQVLWIKDIAGGERAEELLYALLSKLGLPANVDPTAMRHHPHHILQFENERAGAIDKLVDEWTPVVEFLTLQGGKGAKIMTENMRAQDAVTWYERRNFLHLAVRKNRELLAEHAGIRKETYFQLRDNDHEWQEQILRQVWEVSRLTRDTCPMFKAFRRP